MKCLRLDRERSAIKGLSFKKKRRKIALKKFLEVTTLFLVLFIIEMSDVASAHLRRKKKKKISLSQS